MDTLGQNHSESWDCLIPCKVSYKRNAGERTLLLDVKQMGLPRLGDRFTSSVLIKYENGRIYVEVVSLLNGQTLFNHALNRKCGRAFNHEGDVYQTVEDGKEEVQTLLALRE